MYADRSAAGRLLAEKLTAVRADHPMILALLRGGVPVAAEIARLLHAPLKVLFVRKLGLPQAPEVAMGAVIDGERPLVFRNADVLLMSGVGHRSFQDVLEREMKELKRRKRVYPTRFHVGRVENRTVILVDDGAATGSSMEVAIRAMRECGAERVIVALPVAPPSVLHELRSRADTVICPLAPAEFDAIGTFYEDFPQLGDEEVLAVLARTESRRA